MSLKRVAGVVDQTDAAQRWSPKVLETGGPVFTFPKTTQPWYGTVRGKRQTEKTKKVAGFMDSDGVIWNPKLATTGITKENISSRAPQIAADIAIKTQLTDEITANRMGTTLRVERKKTDFSPILSTLANLGATAVGLSNDPASVVKSFKQVLEKFPDVPGSSAEAKAVREREIFGAIKELGAEVVASVKSGDLKTADLGTVLGALRGLGGEKLDLEEAGEDADDLAGGLTEEIFYSALSRMGRTAENVYGAIASLLYFAQIRYDDYTALRVESIDPAAYGPQSLEVFLNALNPSYAGEARAWVPDDIFDNISGNISAYMTAFIRSVIADGANVPEMVKALAEISIVYAQEVARIFTTLVDDGSVGRDVYALIIGSEFENKAEFIAIYEAAVESIPPSRVDFNIAMREFLGYGDYLFATISVDEVPRVYLQTSMPAKVWVGYVEPLDDENAYYKPGGGETMRIPDGFYSMRSGETTREQQEAFKIVSEAINAGRVPYLAKLAKIDYETVIRTTLSSDLLLEGVVEGVPKKATFKIDGTDITFVKGSGKKGFTVPGMTKNLNVEAFYGIAVALLRARLPVSQSAQNGYSPSAAGIAGIRDFINVVGSGSPKIARVVSGLVDLDGGRVAGPYGGRVAGPYGGRLSNTQFNNIMTELDKQLKIGKITHAQYRKVAKMV